LSSVWNALVVASDDPALAKSLEAAIRLRGPAIVACGWSDLNGLSLEASGTPQLLLLGAQSTTSLADLLEQVHRYAAKTPVVVCLPNYDEDTLIALYDAGVADVVFPPMPPVHIAARVLEALERDTLQKQWLQRDAVLQALHHRDAATGLWSPDAWLALLTHTLQSSHAEHGLMVLPLPSNAASAETIATLGRVLLSTLRGTDAWALLDGPKSESPKKLGVLLPNTPTAQVAGVVQRVCNLLQHHHLALTPVDWCTLPLASGESTLAVLSRLSAA
jgi:DNA-binding response OmpR family regulator